MYMFDWERGGAQELVQQLERDGIIVIRSAQLCEQLVAQPMAAMTQLLGAAPLKVNTVAVTPVPGRRSIVESSLDGRLHVDAYPMLSPDLVVMSCYQQSEGGGESVFVDAWETLSAIRKEAPELYAELFLTCRQFRFPAYNVFSPTFSLRQDFLMCHHATFPGEGDEIGARFQAWVDCTRKIAFKLEPGDLYIINNHRFLHGRTRFFGERRLQRLQAWTDRSLAAPEAFVEAARLAYGWRTETATQTPKWIKQRFGLTRASVDELDLIPSTAHDAELSGALQLLPSAPRELAGRILALEAARLTEDFP
ncbi:MAG: TauD/TfdA family dioxygenase [Luteimonas sp.]